MGVGPFQLKTLYSILLSSIPVGSHDYKRQGSICQTFWNEVTVAVLPAPFHRLLLLPFCRWSGSQGRQQPRLPGRAQRGPPSLSGQQAASQTRSSEEQSERSAAYIKPASRRLGICRWVFCGWSPRAKLTWQPGPAASPRLIPYLPAERCREGHQSVSLRGRGKTRHFPEWVVGKEMRKNKDRTLSPERRQWLTDSTQI